MENQTPQPPPTLNTKPASFNIPSFNQKPDSGNNKSKLVVLIFSFMVVFGVIIGVLAYQNYSLKKKLPPAPIQPIPSPSVVLPPPTKDDTDNRKIYKNIQYGFQFLYPADLTFLYDQLTQPGTNLLLQNYDGNIARQKTDSDFQLVLYIDEDLGLPLEERIENSDSRSDLKESSKTINYITIDGKKAARGINIQKYEEIPTVWIINNGYLFMMQLSTPKSKYALYFDQILSTFKFLDQTNATKGKVEGKICYPSDHVPDGYILAKNIVTGQVEKIYFEGVPPKTQEYVIELDPGSYIFAYDPGGHGLHMGFWTPCAPTMHVDNCSTLESHQLTEVDVAAGQTVNNIDLCDYYYPPEQKPSF